MEYDEKDKDGKNKRQGVSQVKGTRVLKQAVAKKHVHHGCEPKLMQHCAVRIRYTPRTKATCGVPHAPLHDTHRTDHRNLRLSR